MKIKGYWNLFTMNFKTQENKEFQFHYISVLMYVYTCTWLFELYFPFHTVLLSSCFNFTFQALRDHNN